MIARERVRAALSHCQPDRVPYDLAGTRSSGISAIAYRRLREYLGLPRKPLKMYDIIQQLALVDDDVLDLFHVDTVELGRGFAQEDKHWKEWQLPDGTPCLIPAWSIPERQPGRWIIRSGSGREIARQPDGALYFEQVYWPYAEQPDPALDLPAAMAESMWTAIASPPGPLAGGPGTWDALAEGARALRDTTDRAIVGLFGGNLLELGQFLYRNDNFFLLLAGDADRAHAFLHKATDMYMAKLENYLAAAGPYIDVISYNDDLGMQNGPQISPRMYRELFKPHYRRMFKRTKELAPHVTIMLHTCGGIRELLPDLIDDGLEAFNPVQITCRGMESRGLKRDFGKQMVFWGGGCDTRNVLPNGTPDEVRKHVQEQVSIFNVDGGFVFQQVHNILADVPPENIVAMVEAAQGRKL
jgi:uroporphyrinogen decarboxylase